jgi:hypothetical protein
MGMLAKVGEYNPTTKLYVIKDYKWAGIKPTAIGSAINAYSVTLEDGLCFFASLWLLTRGLN